MWLQQCEWDKPLLSPAPLSLAPQRLSAVAAGDAVVVAGVTDIVAGVVIIVAGDVVVTGAATVVASVTIFVAGAAVVFACAAIVIAGAAVAVADAAIVIPGDAVVAGVALVVAGAVVIVILLPREVTGNVVNVVRRDITMTCIFRCLWAPARQPRWVGRWNATPASHAALQAALFRRVSLQGRRRCKHSAVNVIMRDGYTALATMVAQDRISMSIVTQVQAENLKRHEFTNMRVYLP